MISTWWKQQELNLQGPKAGGLQPPEPANAQCFHEIENETAGAAVARRRQPFLDPLHISKIGPLVLWSRRCRPEAIRYRA